MFYTPTSWTVDVITKLRSLIAFIEWVNDVFYSSFIEPL